jgi:hypothetical protein
MLTREIARDEWIRFFDDFSAQHEGWIITLEMLGSDLGDQEEVDGLPLVGISADLKDRADRVEIMAGGRPDADITHFIEAPQRVWFKPSLGVGDEALEIDSRDGIKRILRFQRVPPEATEHQISEQTAANT